MSKFRHMTFLKVLSTIAWADGEVTHSELNVLKGFYRKFGLDRHDVNELAPYMEAPVSQKHREELFHDLLAQLSSDTEKQELLEALESLAATKKKVDDEERQLAAQFTAWLKKSSLTTRSFGKFKSLFQRTLFSHTRDIDPDLQKYFKRKVLDKIRRKSARQGKNLDLADEDMYHICLIGTLLASVAHEDGGLDEAEKKSMEGILSERFGYQGKALTLLLEVIEEQVRQGFDFHEVMTQVNQTVTFNERQKLMDCFFAIAIADGGISHAESEQIRRITKAMHIRHQDFKAAKIKALQQIG